MANEPKKELTMTRAFDAPRELVWKAWTDPMIAKRWWGPRGVTNPVCEIDPRKGGRINIVMRAGKELGDFEGQEWPMAGVFDEVSPHYRLVFTSEALQDRESMRSLIQTRTTVSFEDVKGKTKLTLHIVVMKKSDTPAAEFAIQGMEMGWTQSIDKLGEELARNR